MEKAIEIALRTWYPKDHPLHSRAHHPLGKLLGEWGEVLDDYMKLLYKPNYKPNFADELGDIWYYIRILCYQRDYQPDEQKGIYHVDRSKYDLDRLITLAIQQVSHEFYGLLIDKYWSLQAIDISYAILLELLDSQHLTLDELTELNWQKLQPGSVRGEEWVRAWNGT